LLFDEPTAGLDREGHARVRALLRRLPDDGAVVIAAHDAAFLADCGCRVLALGPDGLTPV
jgi:energy-coupling factor transporter ATP-binding protein EcfA2